MGRSSAAGGVQVVAASFIGGPRTEDYGSTGNPRELDQRAEALDKPAERWRQSSWEDCFRVVGENSRSRNMDGVRKFISVDNHEAVKVGDLHRETRSNKVVKPKFTTDFPGKGRRR